MACGVFHHLVFASSSFLCNQVSSSLCSLFESVDLTPFSQLLPFFPDHFSFSLTLVTFSKASVVFFSQFCVTYHQKNKSYAGEGLVLSV